MLSARLMRFRNIWEPTRGRDLRRFNFRVLSGKYWGQVVGLFFQDPFLYWTNSVNQAHFARHPSLSDDVHSPA